MVAMTTAENLVLATQRVRESAQAVGVALASVAVYAEPAITRAVQAEQNLYARIGSEFGMLTGTRAGPVLDAPEALLHKCGNEVGGFLSVADAERAVRSFLCEEKTPRAARPHPQLARV